jgi:hypothetical protein
VTGGRRDVRELVKAADALLGRTTDRRHRRILENYRRHSLLEVTGRWQEIFEPDMTVEHPVYYVNSEGQSTTLDGYEQVAAFYKSMSDVDANVMVLEDEELAVADWGFASESTFNIYLRGGSVRNGDPAKFYVQRRLISMHWRYDDRERLIGEHVYEHVALAELVEIPADEFITQAEAERILTPLIRPVSD